MNMLSEQKNFTSSQKQQSRWWENISKRKPVIFFVAAVGITVIIAVIFYLNVREHTRNGETNDDTTPSSPHHTTDVTASSMSSEDVATADTSPTIASENFKHTKDNLQILIEPKAKRIRRRSVGSSETIGDPVSQPVKPRCKLIVKFSCLPIRAAQTHAQRSCLSITVHVHDA